MTRVPPRRERQRTKDPDRFKLHFTPTSSSWLNLVEYFFADLTGDMGIA
jgi:hypothetical protein